MTESMHGLPSHPDQQPPGEFEMPSDTVLLAEANRDLYESLFIYKMIRTPDLPEEPLTPTQKTAVLQARVALVRMYLTSPYFEPQGVIDEIDMVSFASGTVMETTTLGIVTGEVPVEPYQLENSLRTGANIVQDIIDPDIARISRKALIKRFKEAQKLAAERGVAEEQVFLDQQLYFELVRRSTSPEDLVAQTRAMIKNYRAMLNPLIAHDFRMGMLIANSDNSKVTVDEIDEHTAKFVENPRVKDSALDAISQLEDFLHANTLAAIERYWGPQVAALFQ